MKNSKDLLEEKDLYESTINNKKHLELLKKKYQYQRVFVPLEAMKSEDMFFNASVGKYIEEEKQNFLLQNGYEQPRFIFDMTDFLLFDECTKKYEKDLLENPSNNNLVEAENLYLSRIFPPNAVFKLVVRNNIYSAIVDENIIGVSVYSKIVDGKITYCFELIFDNQIVETEESRQFPSKQDFVIVFKRVNKETFINDDEEKNGLLLYDKNGDLMEYATNMVYNKDIIPGSFSEIAYFIDEIIEENNRTL